MPHAVAALQERIKDKEKAEVGITGARERPVFPLPHAPLGNTERDLHIGMVVCLARDEVTLQLTDLAHAHLVATRLEVGVEHILERGAIVDAIAPSMPPPRPAASGALRRQVRQDGSSGTPWPGVATVRSSNSLPGLRVLSHQRRSKAS